MSLKEGVRQLREQEQEQTRTHRPDVVQNAVARAEAFLMKAAERLPETDQGQYWNELAIVVSAASVNLGWYDEAESAATAYPEDDVINIYVLCWNLIAHTIDISEEDKLPGAMERRQKLKALATEFLQIRRQLTAEAAHQQETPDKRTRRVGSAHTAR